MCEKCASTKVAVLQMLAAHVPTLATSVAQRVAFDDCFEAFLTIYPGTEEEIRVKGTELSSANWDRLHHVSVEDLNRMRWALIAIRDVCGTILGQIRGVIEDKVVMGGETEGLDPQFVLEVHEAVLRKAVGKLVGAKISESTHPLDQFPFNKSAHDLN